MNQTPIDPATRAAEEIERKFNVLKLGAAGMGTFDEADTRDIAAITDTQRLDWLQSTNNTVWRVWHQEKRLTTDPHRPTENVDVFDGWAVIDEDNPCDSIRAAIDAAIQQEKP